MNDRCLGYPRQFLDEPELQSRGWAHRVPPEDLVFRDRWQRSARELAS